MKPLTLNDLGRALVYQSQRALFREHFGDGVIFMPAVAAGVARVFDWDHLADHLLRGADFKNWRLQRADIRDVATNRRRVAHEKLTGPDLMTALAQIDYDECASMAIAFASAWVGRNPWRMMTWFDGKKPNPA